MSGAGLLHLSSFYGWNGQGVSRPEGQPDALRKADIITGSDPSSIVGWQVVPAGLSKSRPFTLPVDPSSPSLAG